MRGLNTNYKRLGQLLREGRERKGMDLLGSAMILGLTNRQYLWRCENGHSNFPAKKLKRALELYRIPQSDALSAASADFNEGLSRFLQAKK